MSYFPEDIPFMSEEERRFYGINIPKECKTDLSFVPTEEEVNDIFGIDRLTKLVKKGKRTENDGMNTAKSDEYMRGFRDGVNVPRVGDEVMRSYGDRGVITNVDYVEELVSIMWHNGKCSREGLCAYPTTGMTYGILRILRELSRKG